MGRELRAGSDLTGAADAYRAAIKLDPDDHSAQGDLAILLEYDSVGRRYSGQSKMKEAIAEYEKLGQDKLADLGLTNNLAFALFYGGDYAGAFKAAQTLNPQPKALIAASKAMLHGSKAGSGRGQQALHERRRLQRNRAHRGRDADEHPPVSAGRGLP